jgi:hypothetical protein
MLEDGTIYTSFYATATSSSSILECVYFAYF